MPALMRSQYSELTICLCLSVIAHAIDATADIDVSIAVAAAEWYLAVHVRTKGYYLAIQMDPVDQQWVNNTDMVCEVTIWTAATLLHQYIAIRYKAQQQQQQQQQQHTQALIAHVTSLSIDCM